VEEKRSCLKPLFLCRQSLLRTILFVFIAPTTSTIPVSTAATFNFVSMRERQAETAGFTPTVDQVANLEPDPGVFIGDLENAGVISTEMNPMVTAIRNAGLFSPTFLVRGNRADERSGSATLFESYLETSPNVKVPISHVNDHGSLNSSMDYLNYSFLQVKQMPCSSACSTLP
jgi:hypothetical protein